MRKRGSVIESVEGTLDEVSRLHALRRDAEAGLFALAAMFADQHCGDSIDRWTGSGRVFPGMERAVRIGGVGTPRVAEFAFAELGARMQLSPWSARRLVADALDVRHRLPLIWARVLAGEARVSNARLVAAKTRHLSVQAAGRADAAMVGCVDGSVPWGRFEARLAGKVIAADPVVAAAREDARVAEQFARRTRSSEEGTAGFYVRSTVGVIARLDATVGFVAEALAAFGDRDGEDVRRVKAVALLANPVRAVELLAAFAASRSDTVEVQLPDDVECPVVRTDDEDSAVDGTAADPADVPLHDPGDVLVRMDAFARKVGFTPTRLPDWLAPSALPSADPPDTGDGDPHDGDPPRGPTPARFVFDWARLLPPLTLYLHFSADDVTGAPGGVVRWEGEGPVTHAFVHQHLRPLHGYVIKPVIDLARQASVDAYEVPDGLREAVHLMAPADVFPFAGSLSRKLDVDHTEAYDPTLASRAEECWSTRLGNLGPLGRFHHRIKTHGRWVVRQPFTGIFVWRDPHGMVYLDDHAGTRQISRPGRPAGSARGHDPEVELHPAGVLIEVDFHHPD